MIVTENLTRARQIGRIIVVRRIGRVLFFFSFAAKNEELKSTKNQTRVPLF